jgi:hypothetical protein
MWWLPYLTPYPPAYTAWRDLRFATTWKGDLFKNFTARSSGACCAIKPEAWSPLTWMQYILVSLGCRSHFAKATDERGFHSIEKAEKYGYLPSETAYMIISLKELPLIYRTRAQVQPTPNWSIFNEACGLI